MTVYQHLNLLCVIKAPTSNFSVWQDQLSNVDQNHAGLQRHKSGSTQTVRMYEANGPSVFTLLASLCSFKTSLLRPFLTSLGEVHQQRILDCAGTVH